MALARIRTHFPEEVSELCEALREAGYVVEIVRPGQVHILPADLELTVDKLPVVDAWRHVPNADEVYVAPDTPESRDIRSALNTEGALPPLLSRFLVETGERYNGFTAWLRLQAREIRARAHELRLKWTPPREYHTPVHLEPVAPASLNETRIDAAIEHAHLEVVSRNEKAIRRQEAERQHLAEKARAMEESRERAREAAEAKALLEEQKKIEAMVRASEKLRQRVLNGTLPPKREAVRKRPRRLLRTQRDRAFFRAGVAAFALSMGLAMLAAEALHPRPASLAIPQNTAHASGVPFAPHAIGDEQDATGKAPNPSPSFTARPAAAIPASDTSLKAPASKASHMRRISSQSDVAADDVEVIVRKPLPRRQAVKPKGSIAHYSDLD